MEFILLGAAGLAEAAWAFEMMLMGGGLLVTGFCASLALTVRSRKLAIAAIVLLAVNCVYFQPWYCFTPFEADAYDDLDVVSAAGSFQFLGICWLATTAFTIFATIIAYRAGPIPPPVDTEGAT